MSSVLSDFFLWNQSVNSSCGGRMECESLFELGPPPNLILTLPPPPVPPFMEEFVARLVSEGLQGVDNPAMPPERSRCQLCRWAVRHNMGFVELPQEGPLIDDTWFLVIISSCVGVALLGIFLAIALLKYRGAKLKPLSDVALAKKEKVLGLERSETVLYPSPQAPSTDTRTSRGLWAGLKPLQGNHYTVDHCQPVDQKPVRLDLLPNSDSTYDYADYSSITYTSIEPSFGRSIYDQPIPQLNLTVCNKGTSPSFENVGFVPAEDSQEVQRVSRAAFLLGAKTSRRSKGVAHIYEMVTPRTRTRRHKSLERRFHRQTPVISAPTNIPTLRLPPLNSRYNGGYMLTTLVNVNGSHTLTSPHYLDPQKRLDRKFTHVTLDKSGMTNIKVAATLSPSDNIYSSPMTSPVI